MCWTSECSSRRRACDFRFPSGFPPSFRVFIRRDRMAARTWSSGRGLLSATERKDTLTGTEVEIDRAFKIKSTQLQSAFTYGYTGFDSNQNHYDANLTTFVGNYYSYDQQSLGSQLVFGFGHGPSGPMTIDAAVSYSRRNYRSRVIQADDGSYLTDKLNQTDMMTVLGYSYPISKNFRARFSTSLGRTRSNNSYEAVYRYNYNSSNYQFGFTYQY